MMGRLENPGRFGRALAKCLAARSCCLATVLLCGFALRAENGATIRAGTGLRDDWIDPETGHRILRLSRVPGESRSLYFHQNGFTSTGDKVVFENRSTMSPVNRLYAYDFKTGKCELLFQGATRAIQVGRRTRQVYHQAGNTLRATEIDTGATKTLAELPATWRVATINADETLAAGTFIEGGRRPDTSGPKSDWFNKIFEEGVPRGIFTLNLRTRETNVIHRGTNWFNHLQFSPTDPGLLMFCHEGPWHKLDRIWLIRADGTGLRLMHKRSMPMEIAGHEFWSPDGKRIWFDLQTPRGQEFFLAGVDVETGVETRYRLSRDQWSVHYNISPDQKLFSGDGGSPGMVAHARNGQWLRLFHPQPDGTLREEKLVNMARQDYELEPNMNFSPDGKWIVFRGNFDGSPQVYAVEVAKAHRPQAARQERAK